MLGRDGSSYNPEGTECGALAVPTRTVPVSGKFGPVEFHVPRRLVSKASFPAHRSNEYRAARTEAEAISGR
jgi:hypothetical protein